MASIFRVKVNMEGRLEFEELEIVGGPYAGEDGRGDTYKCREPVSGHAVWVLAKEWSPTRREAMMDIHVRLMRGVERTEREYREARRERDLAAARYLEACEYLEKDDAPVKERP